MRRLVGHLGDRHHARIAEHSAMPQEADPHLQPAERDAELQQRRTIVYAALVVLGPVCGRRSGRTTATTAGIRSAVADRFRACRSPDWWDIGLRAGDAGVGAASFLVRHSERSEESAVTAAIAEPFAVRQRVRP